MPPRPLASFPSSAEQRDAVESERAAVLRLARLALGAWAALVYVIYWLGYLGVR